MIFDLIAQASPSSTDPVSAAIVALGSGGTVGLVLWQILNRRESRHAQEMDALRAEHLEERMAWRVERQSLYDRLFKIADKTSMATAAMQRVAEKDTAVRDADLQETLDRLAGLLENRGRP